MNFDGKVIMVTGAGSGIGEGTARLLAERGAKVVLLSRYQHELDKVEAAIRQDGGDTLSIAADITDFAAMTAAVATIEEQYGRLDAVFANAGINGTWAPIESLDLEEWQQTIDINLTGTFITVKTALPLLKQGGGSIVITSSVQGTRNFSNSGASAYASTKAAQLAFGKMIALEFAKHKIRVNIICPGTVETNIIDSTTFKDMEGVRVRVEFPDGSRQLTDGKAATPRDIAELVAFLFSDAAKHISGTEMWIDGGQSLLVG